MTTVYTDPIAREMHVQAELYRRMCADMNVLTWTFTPEELLAVISALEIAGEI